MVRPAVARRPDQRRVLGAANQQHERALARGIGFNPQAQRIRKLGRLGIMAGCRGDGVEAHAAESVQCDRERGDAGVGVEGFFRHVAVGVAADRRTVDLEVSALIAEIEVVAPVFHRAAIAAGFG